MRSIRPDSIRSDLIRFMESIHKVVGGPVEFDDV
jgi:hypothetical protein